MRAKDEAGNEDASPAERSFSVEPPNKPPTADAGGPYEVEEGGSVEVNASGSDPEGKDLTYEWDLDDNGSFETPGQSATFSAADLRGPSSHRISVRVTDAAGASATDEAMVTVKDATAPTIGCGTADDDWHKADVNIWCEASDDGSGLADSGDARFSLSTTVEEDTETGNASTGTREVCDAAGNCATAGPITGIKVDKKAPAVSCSVNPKGLWPPNHKLVTVNASVTVRDEGSGPGEFKLTSATSDEPDNGLGDGDTSNDIQGFVVGTADTSGKLRAERSGTGDGRVYTLTYEGADAAGNLANCAVLVTVSHDRGR